MCALRNCLNLINRALDKLVTFFSEHDDNDDDVDVVAVVCDDDDEDDDNDNDNSNVDDSRNEKCWVWFDLEHRLEHLINCGVLRLN